MPSTARRFQNVLCGIDFSDYSRFALQYAAAMARREDGRVSVVFVNDPLLVRAAAATYDEAAMTQATERELQKFISDALGAANAQRVERVAAVGEPATEIKAAAKTLRADLVVLGTRGLGNAGKLF